MRQPRRFWLLAFVILPVLPAAARAAAPHVDVILWFDTEDYILPASDDAALHVAEFLTQAGIKGTFKVVGEKARTLERRGRTDVIEALKKHEIGYHSNFHSVQPTPAVYLNALGWDDGVAEFDRRERPGFDDVKRIFGRPPTCYGQPGSSWGPQTLGAMRQWGMKVYLDAGQHVGLDGKPFYYCGLLNIYQIANMPRADLKNPSALPEAEERFAAARKQLLAEGGGLVSIIYHPCEFVHKEFWDGVNFRNGANPPREQWKLPPQKTPEETRAAFEVFENYVRFMKHFDDVRFITASDAVRLYADAACDRTWQDGADVKQIAAAVGDDPGFQRHEGYTLSAAEVFAILSEFVCSAGTTTTIQSSRYPGSPYGPTSHGDAARGTNHRRSRAVPPLDGRRGRFDPQTWAAFHRQSGLAADPCRRKRSSARWRTSLWISATASAAPATIEIKPARLASAKYVADDNPNLWKWVIFPPNFRAPNVMALAKRQAWTLKPAIRNDATSN